MKYTLLFACCFLLFCGTAQVRYQTDILGEGFEQASITQPSDYEGKVVCTIVRRMCQQQTKHAVLYIHGFNDYFFQVEMANWYNEHGFNFYAIDLRKYGRSILPEQKMNNVRDLHEYFADIDTALRIIQSESNDYVIINGHSTGGLITTCYAQEHPNSTYFDGIFLNSPFFDFNESWLVKKWGVPFIAKRALKTPDELKKGGFTKWYGYSLHSSEHGECTYNLDWKPHLAPWVNYGWIRAIHLAQEEAKSGREITVPVLVIYSGKSIHPKKWSEKLFTGDAILNVKDIRKGCETLKAKSTSFASIDGLLHDIFLSKEPARSIAYKALANWLEYHQNANH